MDALTLFGLFAVSAMLVCYALESRSHWFVLLFAGSCALGSAYGFLQGRLAVWFGRGNLVYCRNSTLAYGAKIGRPALANRERASLSRSQRLTGPLMRADAVSAKPPHYAGGRAIKSVSS
jgi:hypothetical protein